MWNQKQTRCYQWWLIKTSGCFPQSMMWSSGKQTKPPKDNSPLAPVAGLRAKCMKCDSLQVCGSPWSSSSISIPADPSPLPFGETGTESCTLPAAQVGEGEEKWLCPAPHLQRAWRLYIEHLCPFQIWPKLDEDAKLFREWQVWSPFQPGYFLSVWKEV